MEKDQTTTKKPGDIQAEEKLRKWLEAVGLDEEKDPESIEQE